MQAKFYQHDENSLLMMEGKMCRNCSQCADPANDPVYCMLYNWDRDGIAVCAEWEPRDDNQRIVTVIGHGEKKWRTKQCPPTAP